VVYPTTGSTAMEREISTPPKLHTGAYNEGMRAGFGDCAPSGVQGHSPKVMAFCS